MGRRGWGNKRAKMRKLKKNQKKLVLFSMVIFPKISFVEKRHDFLKSQSWKEWNGLIGLLDYINYRKWLKLMRGDADIYGTPLFFYSNRVTVAYGGAVCSLCSPFLRKPGDFWNSIPVPSYGPPKGWGSPTTGGQKMVKIFFSIFVLFLVGLHTGTFVLPINHIHNLLKQNFVDYFTILSVMADPANSNLSHQ